MTPVEALHVLKQTGEKFVGTRQDHELITKALQTLAEFVTQHGSKQEPQPNVEAAISPEGS